MTTRSVSTDSISSLMSRLRRRWGTFVLVFVVVAGAVIGLKFLLVHQYTAMSAVLIEPDRSPIGRRDGGSGDSQSADASEVESQVEMIRSPRLIQAMLQSDEVRAALNRACEYSASQSSFGTINEYVAKARQKLGFPAKAASCVFDGDGEVIDALSKKFTIFQVGRSRVASIAFQSSLPDTAATVVNGLVNQYLQDNIKAKSNARLTTANWLEEEGLKLRQSLMDRERQIDRYRREHGLLRGQQGLMTQEGLSSLITQLGQARARVAAATARYKEAQAAAQRGDGPADNPAVLNSNTIRDQRAMEASLKKEIGSLTTQYGNFHPRVVAARSELRAIQSNLAAEVERVTKGLATEAASAVRDERALEEALERSKGEAATASDADSAVQSLVRDADIDRQLYLMLASRSKELETETRAQNPNARLVSLADVPTRPSFPQAIPFLGAAVLLGGISGLAAAFIRDYSDKTLRDIDDFVDDFQIPVLARIPEERGLSRRSKFLATISDDSTGFREAIRALHARIQLKGDIQTLLVTSSAPKEGKTSVSVALAHFAASAGHRVLLIEADLRMPVFHKIMPLLGEGLENFLRAQPQEESIVQTPDSRVPGFHVLAAGNYAQDSTELLSGQRMAALLRHARDRYDLVIIDTPPANYLMDACVLARHSDGVLLVARWGQSQPDEMHHAVRAIQAAGGNIIGTAVGMVDHKSYPQYGNPRLSGRKAA